MMLLLMMMMTVRRCGRRHRYPTVIAVRVRSIVTVGVSLSTLYDGTTTFAITRIGWYDCG